ncbi:MAG TPA: hypothetical protein VHG33_10555 [Woeseiaceae bacterium]|nr:hypothetical protein [Woeseiaceae bacterium]
MDCRSLGLAALALLLGACNGEIYLRDGVTDGDTFYLAERALHDSDPVLQSWVGYSLAKSTCQLLSGADNPARATSFECELTAREHLLDAWAEQRGPFVTDPYLDRLAQVQQAQYLDEYVWQFLHETSWTAPPGLEMERFAEWRRERLPNHEVRTRLIGSWGYAERRASRSR